MGAELLSANLAVNGWGEALIHVPKGAGEDFRHQIGLTESLKPGEWYSVALDDGGKRASATMIGHLPRLHYLRRELVILVVRKDICGVLTAHRSNQRSDQTEAWESAFSLSANDVTATAGMLAGSLRQSLPELTDAIESLAGKVEQYRRNYDLARQSRLMGTLIAQVGGKLEERNKRSEQDLRWFRTITTIQDAVGWELDANRLNNSVARALKSSIGYDYLELHTIHQSGRKFEIGATFQKNDTSFGGPLLTVILRPEKQEDLLRAHRPVIINNESAADLLANHRLLGFMGLQSGLLVPLIYQRRPIGLLKLFSKRPHQYAEEDIERIEAIGRVLARSIENAKIHSLMRRMATVDGLTNVYNHRFFTEQVVREFKRAHRYSNKLSILMIDIDFFKNYNDSNGHLQGDDVLSRVAKLLTTNVREVDLVCRYGGEEFVVILPETDMDQARIVAEKVRRAVADHPFKMENRQPGGNLTISIGLASSTPDLENPTELVNRADVALYRAKKLGRNRCEAF